ncbi:hypothetical protein [Aminipila luticellarii]|uniref:Uncharacterized protein n=1 Tax=Aminipila luticellarii TaxID=2507160 RepID=A0A410PT71_9FIRM|nr:hypothetical protein [Aminipila luticellarii]QAT42113.1 hypothetical protein EQM06_02070 [Aminipila luticellarii]
MAYLSLYLSLFYLMSCPLMAILNVKDLDNLYALYPLVQAFAYILYLLKDINEEYENNGEESEEEEERIRLDNLFNGFYILFSTALLAVSYMTKSTIVLSFVLYPLGLKIAFIDSLILHHAHYKAAKMEEE